MMAQAMTETPAKKRIIVGSGWPLVRQPNEAPERSSGSTPTASVSNQADRPDARPVSPASSVSTLPPPVGHGRSGIPSTWSDPDRLSPHYSPSPLSSQDRTQALTDKRTEEPTEFYSPPAPAIKVEPQNLYTTPPVIAGSGPLSSTLSFCYVLPLTNALSNTYINSTTERPYFHHFFIYFNTSTRINSSMYQIRTCVRLTFSNITPSSAFIIG
jgi:hypothetical protein